MSVGCQITDGYGPHNTRKLHSNGDGGNTAVTAVMETKSAVLSGDTVLLRDGDGRLR